MGAWLRVVVPPPDQCGLSTEVEYIKLGNCLLFHIVSLCASLFVHKTHKSKGAIVLIPHFYPLSVLLLSSSCGTQRATSATPLAVYSSSSLSHSVSWPLSIWLPASSGLVAVLVCGRLVLPQSALNPPLPCSKDLDSQMDVGVLSKVSRFILILFLVKS